MTIKVTPQLLRSTSHDIQANMEQAMAIAQGYLANQENVMNPATWSGAGVVASHMTATEVANDLNKVLTGGTRLAEGQGQLVDVTVSGGELAIDRRVADRLIDPVLQLAQNAVAHGIQPPEARISAGKPPVGKLVLGAERIGDWLRITVEDDGPGIGDFDRPCMRLEEEEGYLDNFFDILDAYNHSCILLGDWAVRWMGAQPAPLYVSPFYALALQPP